MTTAALPDALPSGIWGRPWGLWGDSGIVMCLGKAPGLVGGPLGLHAEGSGTRGIDVWLTDRCMSLANLASVIYLFAFTTSAMYTHSQNILTQVAVISCYEAPCASS